MSEEFTGDAVGFDGARPSVAAWVQNTRASDPRCISYDLPREKSAADGQGRELLPRAAQAKDPTSDASDRGDRYALRQRLIRAQDLAARLLEACRQADAMEQAIVGSELTAELQALWRLRSTREEEWAEILNFLQSALAQEEFERFGVGQSEAVRDVVVHFLTGGAVDPDDIVRSRMRLRGGGLDPWKVISSPSEQQDG